MDRHNKKKYIFFAGLASFALVGGIAVGASIKANGFTDYIDARADGDPASEKITYDFTTNFTTYSESWTDDKGKFGPYAQRTVTNTDLGVDLAGTFSFEFASRQDLDTAPIKDRPVIAKKTATAAKALEFSLDDENLTIESVKITFAQWNTRAPTLALFAGKGITGDAIQTITISASALTLETEDLGASAFSISYVGTSGSNWQVGLSTVEVTLKGDEPAQSSEEPAPTPEESSEEPAPTPEQSSEEPTPTPEESSEEIPPSPTTSSEEPVVSSSSEEEPPEESSVTPSDKVTYDFTTNFTTYSDSWKSDKGEFGPYAQRTVTNTYLGVDLAGTFSFEFASRQTTTIQDRPVIANKTIDPKKAFEFSLTDENLVIGSVKITFANWNTKAPTLALFAGKDIVGEALDSVTIGENALTLETEDLGASSFSVSYSGHATQNWQVGISAVEITLKGDEPAQSSEEPAPTPEESSKEVPTESSEVPVESSEAPEESSYVPTTYSEDALRFGERFIKNITCDGGVTAPSVSRWDRLADFFHELGQDDQEAFMDARANEKGNAVEAAVARYDFIIHKYGTKSEENPEGYVDFMSRFTDMVNVGIINRSATSNSNRRTMAIVTTTVFGAALLGAGLIAFSLKRKHKEDK